MIGNVIVLGLFGLFIACAAYGQVQSVRACRQQDEMIRRQHDGCDCWGCRP